jgi:hypothetical protein
MVARRTTLPLSGSNASGLTGKPRKYRNVPTGYDSPIWGYRTYDSKAEAEEAAALDLQVKGGLIKGWIPQVSIPIPHLPGKRMRLDFVRIKNDDTWSIGDVKGMGATRDWAMKRELVERALGIPIDIVTRTRRR